MLGGGGKFINAKNDPKNTNTQLENMHTLWSINSEKN